jgi:hypothetical protein
MHPGDGHDGDFLREGLVSDFMLRGEIMIITLESLASRDRRGRTILAAWGWENAAI